MLYSEYYKRISLWVAFTQKVKRYRIPILVGVAAVLAAIVILLSTRGLVYDKIPCAPEYVYGSDISYSAGAFMTDVRYEFREAEGGEWTSEQPKRVGKYQVRAVGERTGGAPWYGKIHTFDIAQKPVDVTVGDTVVFGENPGVTADVLPGDTIECEQYFYTTLAAVQTTVRADLESVTVTDASGEDVTANYALSAPLCPIAFLRREITVTVADRSEAYDGAPKYYGGHELTGGTLARGDALVAVENTSITEVGEVEVEPRFSVLNENGEDVTINYAIKQNKGKISVTQRVVRVTTATSERRYDGTAFSDTSFTVDEQTPIVAGHRLSVGLFSSQTTVGSKENLLSFKVYGSADEDLSSNYSIIITAGTLSVSKREMTVSTPSDTFEYDGKSHEYLDYSAPSLANGQSIVITGSTTVTTPGEYDNALTVSVTAPSAAGAEDVTANYDITYDYGTLTVEKRKLIVSTTDQAKVYDGEPLFAEIAGLGASGLCDGQTYLVTERSALTDASSVDAAVAIKITDAEEETDATYNDHYDIAFEFGKLEITKLDITVYSASATWQYDGEEHTQPIAEAIEYLLPGHSFAVVGSTPITFVEKDEDGSTRSVANEIEINVFAPVDGADGFENVTHNYEIKYVYGELTVTPRPITVKPITVEKVYDDTPLTVENAEDARYPSDVSARFQCTSELGITQYDRGAARFGGSVTEATFAGGEYYADVSTVEEFSVTRGELDVTDCYDVTTDVGNMFVLLRSITVKTGSNSWIYDGEEHKEETVVDRDGVDIVPGHVLADTAYPGVTDVWDGDRVNAPTLAVMKGETDVTHNYAVNTEFGTVKIERRAISVKPIDVKKVYDDTPLSVDNAEGAYPADVRSRFELTPDSANDIVKGEIGAAAFDGARTDWGESKSNIYYFSVTRDGVDVTDNYAIYTMLGTLTVEKRPIFVTPEGCVMEYDGTPQSHKIHTASNLVEGHATEVFIAPVVQFVDEGEVANMLEVFVMRGTVDKTVNYDISYPAEGECATISISAKPITVTTHSDFNLIYNGLPQSVTGFDVSPSVASGDEARYAGDAPSLTDLGEADNVFTVEVFDGGDTDRTVNYDITYEYGAIAVVARPIEYFTGSLSQYYDDVSHFYGDGCDGHDSDELAHDSAGTYRIVEWHTVQNAGVPVLTDAGSVENDYEIIIKDGDKDVTGNYDIVYRYGTLEIMRRPITVTTPTTSWVYDGTKHADDGYTVAANSVLGSRPALADGHESFVATALPEVEEVEPFPAVNEYEIAVRKNGVDKTANYDITYEFGTIDITPRPLVFTTESKTWQYDGVTHFWHNRSFEKTVAAGYNDGDAYPALVNGHTSVVIGDTRIKNVCDSGMENVLRTKIVATDGTEKTHNYEIVSATYGKLAITPLTVTYHTDGARKYFDGTPLTMQTGAYVINRSVLVTDEDGNKESAEVLPLGTITFPGSAVNNATVKFYSNGVDVTDLGNYTVDENGSEKGTLTVYRVKLHVITSSAHKIYDGTPLTSAEASYVIDEGCTFVGDSTVPWQDVAEGQTVTITATGSITDFGTAPNTYTIAFTNAAGEDMSDGYFVDTENDVLGTLSVSKRPITVETASASWMYDGELHWDGGASATAPTVGDGIDLAAGHSAIASSAPPEVLEVADSCDNVFSVKIVDENGADKTFNYSLEYVYGYLEITQRPVTLLTDSGKWKYDGYPHYSKKTGAAKSSEEIVPGHRVSARNYSEITEVGKMENYADSFKIFDENGYNVTPNYRIDGVEYGELEVYEGTGGADDPGDSQGDTLNILEIQSDFQGYIYILQRSYGDYILTNNAPTGVAPFRWKIDAKEYEYDGLLTYGGEQYGMRALSALSASGTPANTLKVRILSSIADNALPDYLVPDSFTPQKSDVVNRNSDDYSVMFYPYDYVSDNGASLNLPAAYREIERRYAEYVRANYLNVPASTAAFMRSIIAKEGFASSSETVVADVANYIRHAAEYDLEYDKKLDFENDVAIAFLRDYKKGICQHYAMSATLMFRTLGIPARYCEGISAESSASGNWETVGADRLHAWTEVYIDGAGWFHVEVTGGGANGNGNGSGNGSGGGDGDGGGGDFIGEGSTKDKLVIDFKPIDLYAEAKDGELRARNVLVDDDNVLDNFFKRGYRYDVTVSGAQNGAGESESEILTLSITNGSGTEVYRYTKGSVVKNDDEYLVVTVSKGKLVVTDKSIVRVRPYRLSKHYDGTPITLENSEYAVTMPAEFAGYRFAVVSDGTVMQTAAGTKSLENVRTLLGENWYKVYDAAGNDRTKQFNAKYYPLVDFDLGENDYESLTGSIDPIRVVTVKKAVLHICTETYFKAYDGKPLSMKNLPEGAETELPYYIVTGKLLLNHRLVLEFENVEITEVGEKENKAKVAVVDPVSGKFMTKNYEIKLEFGYLVVY